MAWRWIFGGPRQEKSDEKGSELLKLLTREYIEEMRSAERFSHHAAQMIYPQYREKLRSMAAEERSHAAWVGEKIRALGGQIPEILPRALEHENSWQSLLLDLEAEKRCVGDLVEAIAKLHDEHPDIAAGLARILAAEEKQRDQICDMLMRSDPQAGWAG